MIQHLYISNYALISEIDIDFDEGLNIITGETGAGKSIILGALSLLLGGRSDSKVIGDTNKKSVIEAEFKIDKPERFKDFFADNDLDYDGGLIILRRELSPNGRTRAFINDSPVSVAVLKELAMQLVDIHSQNQNLLLADGQFQLQIIDSLCDNQSLLDKYHIAYNEYQTILKKYVDTRDMINRGRSEADFLSYQLKELDELALTSGEQQSLEDEKDILSNLTETKSMISQANEPFNDENNVIASLENAVDALKDLGESIGEAGNLAARLDAAIIELRDIAAEIEGIDNEFNADPTRLEYIDERLRKIYSLEFKHHVNDSDALIDLHDKLANQLEVIENGDSLLSTLETQAKKAKKQALLIAREISEQRQQTAKAFGEKLREAAVPLGMKNLRCEICITSGKLNPSGIDTVDFLFAFNKNQALMSVGQTASGGEISRLMLVIKAIVGDKMQMPTIIFDEIDTGVSGDVASRMGELMKTLSQNIQVITITHLPQVAAKGDAHFKVYKQDNELSTNTHISRLSADGRIKEIALMLSGDKSNSSAIETAKSLLNHGI